MTAPGVARRLAGAIPLWGRLAWWGLVSPRLEQAPLRVLQAAILSHQGVLLSLRSDLRGWELPGGTPLPGEPDGRALRREVREETGLEVEIERGVGDYVRTGFRPHTARVLRCRVAGGDLRPSAETPELAWWDPSALPATVFPWYRTPIADALPRSAPPVVRREHWGAGAIAAGMVIDLKVRWAGA